MNRYYISFIHGYYAVIDRATDAVIKEFNNQEYDNAVELVNKLNDIDNE